MSDIERDALENRIANIEAELELSKAQLAEVNERDEAAKPKKKEPVKAPPKAPAKPVAKK